MLQDNRDLIIVGGTAAGWPGGMSQKIMGVFLEGQLGKKAPREDGWMLNR